MPVKQTKEIKICELIKCRPYEKNQILPVLRMEGRWLESLGFHAGQMAVITCSKDKLVIRPKLSRAAYKKLLEEEPRSHPEKVIPARRT
jgi:hypothetical protein